MGGLETTAGVIAIGLMVVVLMPVLSGLLLDLTNLSMGMISLIIIFCPIIIVIALIVTIFRGEGFTT